MKIIVSVDNNWGIGKDNELLMRIPNDMKQFRQKTTGNVIVMGRKTLESFPNSKPLPNRENIVISSNKEYSVENVIMVHSIEEVLESIKKYDKDIYVVGGGSVYKTLLPYCNEAYITKINHVFEADTFLDNLDEDANWIVGNVEYEDVYDGIEYKVIKYVRI